MIRHSIARNACIGAMLLTAAQTASAQALPPIVVAFDVIGPVPMGSWVAAAAALGIAVTAALMMRSRHRLMSNMVAIAGALLAGSLALVIDRAEATTVVPTSLVTSPASGTVFGQGTYSFINAAGSTIFLRSVTMAGPNYAINPTGTTCVPGTFMSVGQSCVVVVGALLPP